MNIRLTSLSILGLLPSLTGCVPTVTASERQQAVLSAGSAVYLNGCRCSGLDGQDATEWHGTVYVLPAATYKALMRTPK